MRALEQPRETTETTSRARPSAPSTSRRNGTRRPWIRLLLLVAIAVTGFLGLTLRPVLQAALSANSHLRAAANATFSTDPTPAERHYRIATADLQDAKTSLASPTGRTLLAIPIIGRWMRTTEELIDGGLLVSEAGLKTATWWQQARPAVRVRSGGLDIATLRDGAADLEPVQALLARAAQTVHEGPPPLTALTSRFNRDVASALKQITTARTAMPLAASMLDGNKRYFLAMQTPAELRATGGLIGTYGILEVRNGKMQLGEVGRPRQDLPKPSELGVVPPGWYSARYDRYGPMDVWQNINMSPDFPTTASLIVQAAARVGSIRGADGVIAMDPVALEAMLRLTGPVEVKDWREPISAGNVVDVLSNKAYSQYEEQETRLDFFGEVTQLTWSKLFGGNLALNHANLKDLGKAFAGRHMQFYSANPEDQARLAGLGVAGELAAPGSRPYAVVSQNASGHKADYYLRRSVTYDIALQPQGGAVTTVTVRVYNGAPASGEPAYVIGPNPSLPQDPPGFNRNIVSVYAPPGTNLLQASSDGTRSGAESGTELGIPVFTHMVELGPQKTTTYQMTLYNDQITTRSQGKTLLDLVFRTQPMLFADTLTVRLRGEGWKIRPRGSPRRTDGGYEWRTRHDRDVRIEAVVSR